MLPEFDPRWLRGSRDDCEICEFFPRRVRPRLSLPGRVRYLLDTVGNWSTNCTRRSQKPKRSGYRLLSSAAECPRAWDASYDSPNTRAGEGHAPLTPLPGPRSIDGSDH